MRAHLVLLLLLGLLDSGCKRHPKSLPPRPETAEPDLRVSIPESTAVERPSLILQEAVLAYRTGDIVAARDHLESLRGNAWAQEQERPPRLWQALTRTGRWPYKPLENLDWKRGGPIPLDEGIIVLFAWDPNERNTRGVLTKLGDEQEKLAGLGATVVLLVDGGNAQALENTLDTHDLAAATIHNGAFYNLTFRGRGVVVLEDGVVRWDGPITWFGHSDTVAGLLEGPRPQPQGRSPWLPPEPEPATVERRDDEAAFLAEVDGSGTSLEEASAATLALGKEVYMGRVDGLGCAVCHGEEGAGTPGTFPPLVGQAEHLGDCHKTATIVIHGLSGRQVVEGVTYDGTMPPNGGLLDDVQVAAVASYVRQSWGNDYGFCAVETSEAAR